MTALPEEFLRGIELFNTGRYFECHEVWEGIWLRAEGEDREFLHAMIQAAASLHHLQRGNFSGARSVGKRAAGKLKKLPAVMMGLDTSEFRQLLEQTLAAATFFFPRIELLTSPRSGEQ